MSAQTVHDQEVLGWCDVLPLSAQTREILQLLLLSSQQRRVIFSFNSPTNYASTGIAAWAALRSDIKEEPKAGDSRVAERPT